ncbi:MAG: tetratricopeptide repeat protein [Polyangiaceae bacterium]
MSDPTDEGSEGEACADGAGSDDGDRERAALELWEEAQRFHLGGDLDHAIDLYDRSIEIHPTAEAHTFRGWAYSFQGRIEEAIEECHRAIDVDPTFGNPYNDIGSYLMKLGRLDEAPPWFEKAKAADRYEPRHFPYMNLARLFASQGQIARAIDELEGALDHAPGEPSCRTMLSQLRRMLN